MGALFRGPSACLNIEPFRMNGEFISISVAHKTYDGGIGCKFTARLRRKANRHMPNEVDAGANIPVKVTTGDAKISSVAFGAVSKISAEGSTVRLHVSPNAELVGTPQGVTLANGVLSISNVLSTSKTASRDVTVTAKPAESEADGFRSPGIIQGRFPRVYQPDLRH